MYSKELHVPFWSRVRHSIIQTNCDGADINNILVGIFVLETASISDKLIAVLSKIVVL